MSNGDKGALEVYGSAVKSFFIPLSIAVMIGIGGWVGKIEDRLFALQSEAVTKQQMDALEGRVTSYIDVRLRDLDNKMQLMINQQSLLIDLSRDKNNNK